MNQLSTNPLRDSFSLVAAGPANVPLVLGAVWRWEAIKEGTNSPLWVSGLTNFVDYPKLNGFVGPQSLPGLKKLS